MAPTIDIIRTGDSFKDGTTPALLTDEGSQQCLALHQAYPHHDKVKHILVSPLHRAIQTAQTVFSPTASLTLVPELQETSFSPMDTGVARSALKSEFGNSIDTSRLGDEHWYRRKRCSPFFPSWRKIEARARAVREMIRDLARDMEDDERIVVITHGFFAQFLTQSFDGITTLNLVGNWENAKVRSFQFAEGEERARLVEIGVEEVEDEFDGWVQARQRIWAVGYVRRQEEWASWLLRDDHSEC